MTLLHSVSNNLIKNLRWLKIGSNLAKMSTQQQSNMKEIVEKTFDHQNKLPNLPIPKLESTLNKYLDSVRAIASPSQYKNTCAIVETFAKSEDAKTIQNFLVQRSKTHRNWLTEWWEDNAYLYPRYPVHPLVNFGGTSDAQELYPKINTTNQLDLMSDHMHQFVKYWLDIRREKICVMRSRGTIWCMNQVYRYLNSCRVPHFEKDEIKHHFRLESEGPCPSHIIVLCRGHIWKVNGVDSEGRVMHSDSIRQALVEIQYDSKIHTSPVSALSSGERNHWAQARNHLISLSSKNANILHEIESAICVFSLTDHEPNNYTQMGLHWLCINPGDIWADKCVSYMVHKNGTVATSCDHANIDAIVCMQSFQRLFDESKIYNSQNDYESSRDDVLYEELIFTVDAKVEKDIQIATKACTDLTSDLDVNVWHFTEYTNELFRKLRIYGDTVVQMALQLGFMRLHNKPAATYETGSTRKFYHGRTDTVRSCTPETVQWTKVMLDPKTTTEMREKCFLDACMKHDSNMNDVSEGSGADRHLMGIQLAAQLCELNEPEMFTDPVWKMSGGGGNFTLSTSFTGYSDIFGGVAPMIKEGYGCFYKMNNQAITLFMSKYKSCKQTDIIQLEESVRWAFHALRPYLHAYSLKKMPSKPKIVTSKL